MIFIAKFNPELKSGLEVRDPLHILYGAYLHFYDPDVKAFASSVMAGKMTVRWQGGIYLVEIITQSLGILFPNFPITNGINDPIW
jgi:hypothetical protein